MSLFKLLIKLMEKKKGKIYRKDWNPSIQYVEIRNNVLYLVEGSKELRNWAPSLNDYSAEWVLIDEKEKTNKNK